MAKLSQIADCPGCVSCLTLILFGGCACTDSDPGCRVVCAGGHLEGFQAPPTISVLLQWPGQDGAQEAGRRRVDRGSSSQPALGAIPLGRQAEPLAQTCPAGESQLAFGLVRQAEPGPCQRLTQLVGAEKEWVTGQP